MLIVKKLLTKMLTILNGMGIAKDGDYASSLVNATSASPWTAPASGIMTITSATASNVGAYWYVVDGTDNVAVARASRPGTVSYQLSATFPVIKGHIYRSETSGLGSTQTATLYKIGGGYFIASIFSRLAERWWEYAERKEVADENPNKAHSFQYVCGTNPRITRDYNGWQSQKRINTDLHKIGVLSNWYRGVCHYLGCRLNRNHELLYLQINFAKQRVLHCFVCGEESICFLCNIQTSILHTLGENRRIVKKPFNLCERGWSCA